MKTTWHETEDGAAVVVADGKQIARCNVFDPFGQDAVNALRISVCLNACAGTSNSDLADIQHYGGVERLFTYWQEAQQQRDYYKSCILKQAPTWVPSRVHVLRDQYGDPPFRGAGVPAGEHECRCNKWGAVSVIARDGTALGLRLDEFEPIAWRKNEEAK